MATTNTRFIAKNGLDNNNTTIVNVAAPSGNNDAANRKYVDDKFPAIATNSGKVLAVNTGETLLEWVTPTAVASNVIGDYITIAGKYKIEYNSGTNKLDFTYIG